MIWEARGDDAFLSSHLVLSSDEHLVDGGSPHPQRTIANCLYRRGRMVEEWVVRDELADRPAARRWTPTRSRAARRSAATPAR